MGKRGVGGGGGGGEGEACLKRDSERGRFLFSCLFCRRSLHRAVRFRPVRESTITEGIISFCLCEMIRSWKCHFSVQPIILGENDPRGR